MVVYTRTEGGRMGGGEAIQEGTQVREGQEILTIPSTGGMIAEASIHESVLKQVAIGLPCTISVDALPSQQFRGQVRFVAPLPDKGNWWANPNQRLYRTEVSIEEASPEMRPGMNCSIEILVEEIEDAVYVPLQAVVLSKGATVAFVAQGGRTEERKVVIGKQSVQWVQILEGLSEGEEVLLTPPPGFTPQKKDDASSRGKPKTGAPGEAGSAGDGAAAPAPAPGAGGVPAADGAGAGAGGGRGRRGDGTHGPRRGGADGAPGGAAGVTPGGAPAGAPGGTPSGTPGEKPGGTSAADSKSGAGGESGKR